MTKFILAGGYVSYAADGGRQFCRDLTGGFKSPVKILVVFFARSRDSWKADLEQEKKFFADNLHDRACRLIMASPEPMEFHQQVQNADVIWIKGGDTPPLMETLTQDLDWTKHLHGKTVGGTSAGAYALATIYHELDRPVLGQGLGFVPVKIAAHWQSPEYKPSATWDNIRQELEATDPELPVLLLKEGEYRVY